MHPYNDDVALQNARDKELEEYLIQKNRWRRTWRGKVNGRRGR